MSAIGIDVGTKYSRVAVCLNGNLKVISNNYGHQSIASYVSFGHDKRLVGDEAKDQATLNPENTVFNIKRLFGERYGDEEIQQDVRILPYTVRNKNGEPEINIQRGGEVKTYSPEKITSFLLKKMKEVAEVSLRREVREAVITVPVTFNDSQCKSIRDIATSAGLKVLNLTKEPDAAAFVYVHKKNFDSDKNILIYDFGGGKLNVSILTVGKEGFFENKATAGDPHLGGQDFDNRLMKFFWEKIRKREKEILSHKRVVAHIYAEAERVKKALTSGFNERMKYVSLYGGKDFQINISREEFEEMCADLFQAALLPVKVALKSAKMDKSDIDDVILVGGSSRIPKIQSLLKDFFKGKPLTLSLNAELAIVQGAALHAASLSGYESEDKPRIVLKEVDTFFMNSKDTEKQIEKPIKLPNVPEFRQPDNVSTQKPQSQPKIRVTLESSDDGNLLVTSEGVNVIVKDEEVPLRRLETSGIREYALKIRHLIEDPNCNLTDSARNKILFNCDEIVNVMNGKVDNTKRKSNNSYRRKKRGARDSKYSGSTPNADDSKGDYFRKGKKNEDCSLM